MNVVNKDLTNKALLEFIAEQQHNQASFAEVLEVQRATVNGWCRRGKRPSVKLFLRMAALFKQDPSELNTQLGFGLKIPDKKVATRVQILEESVDSLQSTVNSLQNTVAKLQAA